MELLSDDVRAMKKQFQSSLQLMAAQSNGFSSARNFPETSERSENYFPHSSTSSYQPIPEHFHVHDMHAHPTYPSQSQEHSQSNHGQSHVRDIYGQMPQRDVNVHSKSNLNDVTRDQSSLKSHHVNVQQPMRSSDLDQLRSNDLRDARAEERFISSASSRLSQRSGGHAGLAGGGSVGLTSGPVLGTRDNYTVNNSYRR